MKLELHILQNFAPSNLNRDDTGAPKDCDFGGYRRSRISSQCQKRAVRQQFVLSGLLAEDDIGARTKRLVHEVASELVSQYGHDREPAAELALGALEGVGLGRNKKGEGEDGWKTEYLLFVPRRVVQSLAKLLHENREDLAALAQPSAESGDETKKKGAKKAAKKGAKNAYPKEIQKEVEALLEDARATVDLALFGRMIADKPKWNVEAACQVAHAISTNRVQMDFDFFTAVDDFKPDDTAGSDMMGTIQFNSSCYYRYAVLDVDALAANLQLDDDSKSTLLPKAVDAFARAFVAAIPTGKQNSMAAHNFPSYVLGVVRDGGQAISLSNAFLKPARPTPHKELDLVDDSIGKIEDYFGRMREAMGAEDATAITWADRDLRDGSSAVVRAQKLNDLYTQLVSRAVGAEA